MNDILIKGDRMAGKTVLAKQLKAGIQALEPGRQVEIIDPLHFCTRRGLELLKQSNHTLIFVCDDRHAVSKLHRWGFLDTVLKINLPASNRILWKHK